MILCETIVYSIDNVRTMISTVNFQFALMKKNTIPILILFCLLAGGCSKKGASMPKHRKRKHCDCPYFSQAVTSDSLPQTSVVWPS